MAIKFEPNEEKIFEIRKHWIVMVYDVFITVILAIIPIVLIWLLNFLPIKIEIKGNHIFLFIFFYSAWLLVVWNFFFVMWTNYYLDIWIITNRRLIDVDQDGLFHREISTLELSKVQDVTSEVRGILATFLEFGDISVQTAGMEREFIIKNIAHPNIIRQKINEIMTKANFLEVNRKANQKDWVSP